MPTGNVFEDGKGDERQTEAAVMADEHKLFRKRYRQLNPDEVALHDAIKDKADELAALIAKIDPREEPWKATLTQQEGMLASIALNHKAHVVLALRHLEDCVYRAVKALTA